MHSLKTLIILYERYVQYIKIKEYPFETKLTFELRISSCI